MTKIQIHHASKKIKHQMVLENINLTLESRNIIGLKGLNGSGKTMLMRLISGLIKPTEGRIMIDDKELGKDMDFPESIGVLLENPAFLDGYTGFQNLKILASIKAQISAEEIHRVLELVGLDPTDKKKYKKYSLGMKQRLGIAAAIMEKPEIIILDEPANALDEKGILMLRHVLAQERERGALILISCHDADLLNTLSDEIVLLENGHIAEVAKGSNQLREDKIS